MNVQTMDKLKRVFQIGRTAGLIEQKEVQNILKELKLCAVESPVLELDIDLPKTIKRAKLCKRWSKSRTYLIKLEKLGKLTPIRLLSTHVEYSFDEVREIERNSGLN